MGFRLIGLGLGSGQENPALHAQQLGHVQMIAALLDEADRVVEQARAPLDLPKRHQALNKRDVERRGEQLVTGIVELTQTRPDRLDAFGGIAALDRQLAFDAAADRKIGPHGAIRHGR